MHIVFIGPPGAGKGTQSVRLAKYLGVPHLSTGEMLRKVSQDKSEIGLRSAEAMLSGQLVPDELVVEIVFQRLEQDDCRSGCILDGFPRTVHQAEVLDQWLVGHKRPPAVVLVLQVDQEVILERLASRGRQDDDRETIRERLRQYDRLTRPLLDYYGKQCTGGQSALHIVEGEGTQDEVFDRIRNEVD